MKEGGLVKKLKLKFEKKICKDGRRNTENGKQKNCSFFKIDFENNIQALKHCINLQNYGFLHHLPYNRFPSKSLVDHRTPYPYF